MLIDVSIKTRGLRRERFAPRYFRDPLSGFLSGISSANEASRRSEAEQHRQEADAQKAQTQQQKQAQQQQQQSQRATQPQNKAMQDALRNQPPPSELREGQTQQLSQDQQTLKDASGQGVRELRDSEFAQPLPQFHSELRAPSQPGSSLLQNIRNLATGSMVRPEGAPTGRGEGQLANLVRDPSRAAQPAQTGVRVADFSRFAGLPEGGRLPPGTPGNQGALPWASRSGMPQPRPFTPDTPFARLADRAFARAWSPDTLTNLLNQAAQHLVDSHPALADHSLPAAVVMHGNLIFLRDGDRMRTFRLLEDGTLYETSHENEGTPLSPEARALLTKLLKQKGIHARLSGEKEALVEKHAEARMEGAAKDRSMAARGELRTLAKDESHFAQLLREVLEEGHDVGVFLGEGEEALFPEKADWGGFFSKMLGIGSAEKKVKKAFDQIMGFMFRGLFKKHGESHETLVSDIRYQLEGKARTTKFAQIGIGNEELLTLLQNLKPGQPISKDLLQRYFGQDLSFTQLIHVIELTDPILAGEILKNVKFDPSANVDPYSQARLEHHIFSKSRKRPLPGAAGGLGTQESGAGSVFGNVYDLQEKQKREVMGKPKLYTAIAYSMLIFGVLLLLFFLFGRG